MNVATRLRVTFIVLLAVLGTVVIVHAVAMRRTVAATRAISTIATREHGASAQRRRLDDMSESVRKYGVTGDRLYLERLATLASAHDAQLRALEIQAMTAEERSALREVVLRWDPIADTIDSMVIDGRVNDRRAGSEATRRVADAIAVLSVATGAFAAVSRFAMLEELRGADRRAATTERVFWAIVITAILLVGLIASMLVRSIIEPLERLAGATREVARGRFGARVTVSGNDELAIVSRDFNDMSTRLEQLDRMKRDFISSVSHDLKSPLAAMQETNDVLLDGLAGPLSDRQHRLLGMSRDSGKRLASMIHKLLDLSRLDSRPTPNRELLDLFAMTRRAVEHVNMTRDVREQGPTAVLEPSAHLLLRADAEEVSQILDNLLENAFKFSPDAGVVRVALEDDNGVAVLRIADQGPGVPDEEKLRVFERFYQADAGRSVPDHGVGLGLAICRQIAEAHGGTIAVRDNNPTGAVFEVRIPGAITVPAPDVSAGPVELFV